jgi:hypothetical protein
MGAAVRPLKSGQKFGKLTFLGYEDRTHGMPIKCKCRCECGNNITVNKSNLVALNSTSCGECYRSRTGGLSLKQMTARSGVSRNTITARMKRGLPLEKILAPHPVGYKGRGRPRKLHG